MALDLGTKCAAQHELLHFLYITLGYEYNKEEAEGAVATTSSSSSLSSSTTTTGHITLNYIIISYNFFPAE